MSEPVRWALRGVTMLLYGAMTQGKGRQESKGQIPGAGSVKIRVGSERRLSDRDELLALQRAYAGLFDARDADGFADLFTEDAVVTAPWGQVIRGRDKLHKAVTRTPAGEGWHRPGAAKIEVDGDTASAVARFEAMDQNGDLCLGRYEDTYVRGPQGWRIASRKVIIEKRVPAQGSD